jgi:hypothetical protein
MRRVIPKLALLMVAATPFGGACAMSSPDSHSRSCRVIDEDKLPPESGGAAALCAAIQQAAAAKVPDVAFSAEIKVLSSSRLAATLTLEGRQLAEQKFARMDRDLDGSAFERFADILAKQIADERR